MFTYNETYHTEPKIKQKVVRTYAAGRSYGDLQTLLNQGYVVAYIMEISDGVLEYIVEKEIVEQEKQSK